MAARAICGRRGGLWTRRRQLAALDPLPAVEPVEPVDEELLPEEDESFDAEPEEPAEALSAAVELFRLSVR